MKIPFALPCRKLEDGQPQELFGTWGLWAGTLPLASTLAPAQQLQKAEPGTQGAQLCSFILLKTGLTTSSLSSALILSAENNDSAH